MQVIAANESIAAVAKQRYDSEIRSKVEATHRGHFLVLNVHTGEYVMNERHVEAAREMIGKGYTGDDLFTFRVGYPTAYSIGGWPEDND